MLLCPPRNINERNFHRKSVFLGGSIEMGKAIDWQGDMAAFFLKREWNVFNPRRPDWNADWEQSIENAQFYQQVKWELNALKRSDLIIMYFVPETLSPISLLEFGMYHDSGKMMVICPDGFWRKGNIDIVCEESNLRVYRDVAELRYDILKST